MAFAVRSLARRMQLWAELGMRLDTKIAIWWAVIRVAIVVIPLLATVIYALIMATIY